MSNGDSGAGFTIGFLIGAAVGVAVGFLYAPQSGMETRKLLKEKAERAAEKAKEAVEKSKEAAIEAEKRAEAKIGKKKQAE